ncbi:hypothetical protein EXIGLDRAFT_718930, partial [Exidia glandulosa HHB12029]
MSTFISVLPLFLHASLFLFLAGLVLLLWDLDAFLSIWVFFLTAIVLTFYVASTLMPVFRRDCPSATPLTGPSR